MIIVSDTSPIANLIQVDALKILHQLFGRVIIPPTVKREVLALKKFGVDLTEFENSEWIEVISPIDIPLLNQIKIELDEGESEAIVVAKELHADYILIDERLGTKKAHEIGLQTVGLLGVLIKAKNEKHIEKVKPILDALIEEAGFWIGLKLRNYLLIGTQICKPLIIKLLESFKLSKSCQKQAMFQLVDNSVKLYHSVLKSVGE